MTSSMMAGERRWASARRGGMTVLGKVTVPKPVNLPSQRLENHGMDPTVEIVPKGTLSWGSRPSSSTSNAWGSSTLSPKADGGTSSPSHLSGRPSSGSGTRPSSSCSDRTHEPNYVAWGQSSRPSSASGALTSNQTSLASLRPRSAETRPGSSHLSRFAETSADNSVVWGPTGVSEKLGVASSKNDGFSLSSGDFPTLGSEKENSGKSTDSQDHGPYSRPGSSSRVASGKEKTATSSAGDNSVNANVTVNTWRRDGPQHVEDGMFQPLVEKWQGDLPPYLNANVPPQHFDAWRGPPLNPPGVWYRGPPGGPPYAPPLGPGGFPMEPFPYYRPQIPPPALVNSQPIPPPGAGPRGHHPKTGDIYRPHIPDGYVHPGMPIRPGFYPGPVPYEGYYGPPMGYCNSNERDYPYMGMPAVPPMYSRYPGENAPPDPGSNHARAAPHGPPGRALVSEQVESGHLEDARGPYKVLLKQHNDWDDKRAEDKWEHTVPDNAPYLGKGDPPRKSSQKNEWGSEDRKDGEIYSGRRILGGDEISSQNFDNQGRYSSDLPENRGKAKTIDHSAVHKSENAASTFSQVPRTFPATPKDSTLIQKIEGLNAKVRGSDGRPDAASVPSGEEQMSRSQVVDAKVNHIRNEAATGIGRIPASGNLVPASRELVIPTADNILHSPASSGTTVSRRASHGVQGRLDNRSKRFNTQDADGWRKKPLAAESTDAVLAINSEPSSNVPVQDRLPSVIAAEKYVINLQEKDEGEFLTPMFDPTDCQEQRAKMREIAKQRALQLQKEEEERIREQKAKALAKLEELNRRTQAVDGSHKIEKDLPSVSSQQEKEECQLPTEQVMVSSKSEPPTTELVSNANDQITKGSVIGAAESTDLSNATPMESSENAQLKPVVPYTDSAADPKAAPQVNEGDISRHKRMGHNQRQNISMGDNLTDKLVPASSTEAQKNSDDVAVSDFASIEIVSGEVGPIHESRLPMNPNILAASSAHQRKKSNRISKNKHKSDEVPTVTALVPKESNAEKASAESGKPGASELELDSSLIQPSEQQRTSTEEPSGRASSQWKSQHTRRMPKSHQANRNAEKDAVIWAPVRSDKKTEFIDKSTSTRTLPDTVTAVEKGDKVIQNNPKSKRAEMERYVPKPVAKEQLAQQTLLDETVESSQTVNLTIGNIVCTVEPGNGNGKLNKQSKSHGSWQQRGSQDGSFSISDPSKNIKESSEQQQQLLQPEVNCTKETTKLSDDWPASDGWNISEYFDTAAPISSAIVKDQGVITGRGKRHPFKGHRNVSSGDTDKSSSQSPAHEIVGQTDKSSASKENRTTSHWQPKSQVYAFPNQTGNRPGGGQSAAAEVRDPVKKDLHLHDRVQFAPDHKKERAQHTVQPSNDQSVSEQKNEVVVPNVEHQESKREKKVASFTGQPKPSNQSSVVNTSDLVPPPSGDSQNELQRFSSGFRKNGNQNNRSGRVHESRGDWSLGGQDNRQHNNMSSNRERHRHNSHYEYQPIGQQNYSKSNNFEGPTDGSQNMSRYRERSQGHSRRGGGNFSNWQGGTARVDASYD